MRRARRLWPKLALAAGAALVALVVAELGLRVAGSFSPPEARIKVEPVAADSVTNPLGLRDRYDAVPKSKHLLRIAFLGDSFTYGLGVPARVCFVSQTAELLRRREAVPCVTVNLGRPGVDLIMAYTVLNQVIDTVRPHVVVHVMTQDDLDVDVYEEGQAIKRLVGDRTRFSRYSRLAGLIETRIRWRMASPRIVNHLRGGSTPEQRDRAWRIAALQIESTKALAERFGAAYALFRFPCLRWVDRPETYPLAQTHQRTADLAERLGVPYLDLFDAFAGRSPAAMCLSKVDDHPTPEGHLIAAEAIATFLADVVLPPIRSASATQPAAGLPPTTQRTPRQIAEAEIAQYERIVQLDPTCGSARFWLDQARERPDKR